MRGNLIKKAAVALIVAIFCGAFAIGLAYSADPTPPPPPGDPDATPVPPSGGGGGGSGGSYAMPQFQPYTMPLRSSDGTVIGRLEGRDFNSVLVWAERNGTSGNVSYTLTVEGELNSRPDNCWLDIGFLEPGALNVPPGMESGLALAVVNVTGSPGWSYKGGSPRFTLKVDGFAFNPGDYYLVRCDGFGYQVQKVSVDASGSQASVTFGPPGSTGVFTIIRASIPTPVPTPAPTPSESLGHTTPPPENNGMGGLPAFVAIFAMGALAGAAALLILNIHR